MLNLDETALICDLAETYQIYDYRSLPVKLVAALSAGLRDDSRIKLRAVGIPVSQETLLLALIADRLEYLRYSFSSKHSEKPVSVLENLLGGNKKSSRVMGFKSAEAFEAAMARFKGD